jgi:copper(I)-binding protein
MQYSVSTNPSFKTLIYPATMKNLFLTTSLVFLGLFLTGCSQTSDSPIEIAGAWIREAPPNATAMAGYMQIFNHTDTDKQLVSGNSQDFKIIEFHRSVEKDGVYRMIRHKNLIIPANSMLELKPGDYHLMLITPHKQLKEGDFTTINLVFADNAIISHQFPVKKAVFE